MFDCIQVNIIDQKIAAVARQVSRKDICKDERDLWVVRLERLLNWREKVAA